MRDIIKAPDADTTGAKGNRKTERINCDHLYFITWVMVLTTLIAGWHITDVWTGLVTAACGIVTIYLTNEIAGGSK